MRILFCNFEYPPLGGGGGVINASLAEDLAKRHTVTVLTSQALDLPKDSIVNGVRVVRAPVYFRHSLPTANFASMLAYLPMAGCRGRALLDAGQVDIINTHFVLPTGPVGQYLGNRYGVPNVLSVHGGDLYDPSKWSSPHRHALLRAWIARLARRADAVVAQSRNTLHNLRTYFAPDISAAIIPLGIPEPPPVQASRADYGFGSDEIIVCVVGRLVRRKRVDHLLDVLARLGTETRLVIIGSGPEERTLRTRAAALGISGRITFAGQVTDEEKFRLLAVSDFFASTSHHEGFGLVFLEAMAMSLPVVCYDHGGQTDFLVDGKSGFLVGLGDIDRFAAACRDLCAHPERRRQMAAWNRKRVESLFIGHCARMYEQLFASVLARTERRSDAALR
jgi:L-malate glycosyltransferase